MMKYCVLSIGIWLSLLLFGCGSPAPEGRDPIEPGQLRESHSDQKRNFVLSFHKLDGTDEGGIKFNGVSFSLHPFLSSDCIEYLHAEVIHGGNMALDIRFTSEGLSIMKGFYEGDSSKKFLCMVNGEPWSSPTLMFEPEVDMRLTGKSQEMK